MCIVYTSTKRRLRIVPWIVHSKERWTRGWTLLRAPFSYSNCQVTRTSGGSARLGIDSAPCQLAKSQDPDVRLEMTG